MTLTHSLPTRGPPECPGPTLQSQPWVQIRTANDPNPFLVKIKGRDDLQQHLGMKGPGLSYQETDDFIARRAGKRPGAGNGRFLIQVLLRNQRFGRRAVRRAAWGLKWSISN